jgi:GT2 family glycosyltransferase
MSNSSNEAVDMIERPGPTPNRTTVVTVTYGKRWHLLRQTLTAAFAGGIDRAVIVDNHSAETIGPLAEEAFPGKTTTVRTETNEGSAGGFARGIEVALCGGAEYILLLDDDNALELDAPPALCQAFASLMDRTAIDKLCVLAFRPSRQAEALSGTAHDPIGDSGNGFFGFRVQDIPRKLWSRIAPRGANSRRGANRNVSIPIPKSVAPYGGMFFHRSLINCFGYPDSRFVLYCDDIEFSFRISGGGGELWMIPSARITDLERSWSISEQPTTSYQRWIRLGSEREVFYTARNWAYFESYCRRHSRLRKVNRALYLGILWMAALFMGRIGRFVLIASAIQQGERGELGLSPQFPLDS